MSATVVIVTLKRPDCVRRCLTCLIAQTRKADQVIVVDASPDDLTRQVVAEHPWVLYLRNDNGFGRMTVSRNIGLRAATADVIAFLDDDAFAHEGWLEHLLETYRGDAWVGAVGGRAINNQLNEETIGADRIGKLTANGMLEGWFAADPGRVIEVDHVIGCNMSFRREVLAKLGGFREDYPGISGVREDSDMCLRVRRAGYKILFNPKAAVTHIGAPQATGKRFDTRYAYYASRNHMALLVRNFGPLSIIVWRYLGRLVQDTVTEFVRRLGAAVVRAGTNGVGSVAGFVSGLRLLMRLGRDPARHDPEAAEIRRHLAKRTVEAEVMRYEHEATGYETPRETVH